VQAKKKAKLTVKRMTKEFNSLEERDDKLEAAMDTARRVEKVGLAPKTWA
jgi:hypothetical protein